MKYSIQVDFLEFRAETSINLNNFLSKGIYKFSNGLFLQSIKDYGSMKQSYPYCFKIQLKDDEIGILYAKSLDLSLSSGFNTMLRIENKIFYTRNITSTIKMIVEALGLTRTMIKRLDLAYDTDFDVLTRFKSLYYEPSTKFRLRKTIKVKGTGKDDDELTIGSLKSRSKCISIYNKTNEIGTSHKEYIRNYHKEIFGLKLIYRVELKIMNRLLEIKNIDLLNLGSSDYLETIFNTYFDTLIQFIDLNTNQRIEFISLNNAGMQIQKEKKIKFQGGGKQVKSIINFLDKESQTKEFKGNIKTCQVIRNILLKKYGLETWDLVRKKGANN